MWPKSYYPDCVVISPFSWESIFSYQMEYGGNDLRGSSSQSNPGGANVANFWPFSIQNIYVPLNFFVLNGATASGNVDVGIYANDGSTKAAQIWHSGSTAQSGTSVLQTFAISGVELAPGNYYLALAASSGTATFFGVTSSNGITSYLNTGRATSSMPLPATATLGGAGINTLVIGITNRSVV